MHGRNFERDNQRRPAPALPLVQGRRGRKCDCGHQNRNRRFQPLHQRNDQRLTAVLDDLLRVARLRLEPGLAQHRRQGGEDGVASAASMAAPSASAASPFFSAAAARGQSGASMTIAPVGVAATTTRRPRAARIPPVGERTKTPTRTLDRNAVRSNSSTRRPSNDPKSQPAGPPNNRSAAAASSPTLHLRRKVACCVHPLSPPFSILAARATVSVPQ